MLIVMRQDRQDFQGTAVTVDVALGLDVPYPFLLLNMVLTERYDPAQIRQEMEKIYQVPAAGVLPLAVELVDLGSTDLFSLREPKHAWSQEILKICDAILDVE